MELVTLDEIIAARERIQDTALYTPMLEVPWPQLRDGSASPKPQAPSPLLLKAESLQPMGAFKSRGLEGLRA